MVVPVVRRSWPLGCALWVGLSGCSSVGTKTSSAGVSSGGASTSSGGTNTSTGGSGAGGARSSQVTGGASPTGSGGNASGGAAVTDGGDGNASGGVTAAGGSGGNANGGSSTAGCTRELLKRTVDAYFKALAAHDPSTLPLADNVKFTENGKVTKLGDGGLWKTAGALEYAHSALDADSCSAASEAVVPEGSTALPFALRLKLEAQKITEIETIAVRSGDYKVSGSNFASDPAAIISSATSIKWEDPVPTDQRNTREDIIGWMDKYFKIFPRGVCNVSSDCKRLENGGGSFSCGAGASCDASTGTGRPAVVSHAILADVETGTGVGFDLFMGNTDMHMFKMYGGKVYAVHAILGVATGTGWD